MDLVVNCAESSRAMVDTFHRGLLGLLCTLIFASYADATTIRVHSGGGPAYTDSSSNVWSADYGWTGSGDHVGWYTSASIAGTSDPALFQYDRWDDPSSPELQYSFTVPNGAYQVKLYFAEKVFNWVGARVFNVQMEGTTVFSNLDVYAEAGLNQALVKTATVNVSDGQLNITFIHGTENPFVDAIEIVSVVDTQAPTTPTNFSATTASASQINLSWTASTDNVGVTNYLIERCQGSGCSSFTQIATASGTSYSDTGLSASTTYNYRVRATDAAGNLSGYSSTSSATTSSGGGTQVTDNFNRSNGSLGANWTNVVFSSAELQIISNQVQEASWSYGESLYTGASFGGAQFSELQAVSGLSGNVINLAVRTRQYGTTGTINGYVGKINGADNVWGISRVDNQTEVALVSGPLSYADGDTFYFEANGSTLTLKKNGAILGTVIDSTYTAGDAGFGIWNPGGLVVDNWRGGELSGGGDTQAPTAPTNLTATTASSSQINLSWTASTDNVGVTNYLIERCQGSGCSSFTQLATSTSTAYNDMGLSSAANYTYRVRATDAANNLSSYSSTAAATTQSGGGSGTTIRVHSGGGSAYTDSAGNTWSADYGWTSDADHVGWYTSASIAGTNDPELFRYSRWDDTPAPELSYSFAVPNGAYQVKLYFAEPAYNWTGARIFSVQMEGTTVFSNLDVFAEAGDVNKALIKTATVTVTDGQLDITFLHNTENPFVDALEIVSTADTQAPTVPTNLTAIAASSSQINLGWTASTDNVGVTNYLIERCQGSGCSNFAQITTTASTSYNDTGLSASTTYNYRVRATDAAGNLSGYSSTASATTTSGNSDTTPPSMPTGLVLIASSSDEIDLLWSASTDNVGVTGYRLERCQSAGCSNFTQISTPTATTYYDTGRSASTSYSYRVRAADAAGNLSGYSSVLTVTTLAAGTGCD